MALRFTRFSNSHNRLDETQKVSTLGHNDVQDTIGKEETKFEAIRRFEEYFEGNTLALLEEQPRKRFKRDSGCVHGGSETFRLISSKLPPQPIVLQNPPSNIRSRSPTAQDSSEQRRLRRAQARTAAIEGRDIITQSTHSKRKEGVETFKTSLSIEPVLALLVQEKEPTGIESNLPIIRISSSSSESPSKKKRRRFKSKPSRLRPAFFRPNLSMGTRATGYALGYRGSWMVEDPSTVPYARDKMRRGRSASLPGSERNSRQRA